MRIGFAVYPRFGLGAGGLQSQVRALEANVAALGHEVVRMSCWDDVLEPCDVVHVFSMDGSLLEVGVAAHQRGQPVVLSPTFGIAGASVPGVRLRRELTRVPGMYTDLVRGRLLFHAAAAHVFLNEREAKVCAAAFGTTSATAHILPNGVERTDGSADSFRQRHGFTPDLVQVGAVYPLKNQLLTARCATRAGLSVAFVGSIRDEAYVARCVEAGVDRSCFVGSLPPEGVADAYAAARVAILPSFSEVQPLTLFEAALAGVPIAVSRNVPVAPWLRRFVPRFHPRSTSGALSALRRAEKVDRAALRRAAEETPTWPDVARRLVAVYESVFSP